MANSANRHRRDLQFEEQQLVWLSTKHLPLRGATRKLSALWAGPFRVVKRVTDQAYKLALPAGWKVHDVFHTSQLKAVVGDVAVEEQQGIELDGQNELEFEVDKIINMRVDRSGQREFLVAWRGYDSFENSWEPEGNLANCKQLIQQFMQQYRKLNGLRQQSGPLLRSAKTRRGSGVRI